MNTTESQSMSTETYDWVENLKSDEQRNDAIEKLREILLRGLKGAFHRRGQDDAFCEDISQESLIRIMKNVDSFEGRSKFTTWALSIAIRVGISELRRRHYKDVSLDAITSGDDMKIELAVVEDDVAGQAIDQKAILTMLSDLIDNQLTDKQRTVVRALLSGMPVEEIARRTESNRNAVYKLFHDAKQRLKAGFEASDFSRSDIESIFA
jgi:RNA polymerase sigma-70 factor (ECF subfamily)